MQANALQEIGGFPVALIIFAGIAIFLVLRLRSILGRRVGFEKPPAPPGQMQNFGAGPVLEGQALPPQSGRGVPDPRSALGTRLMQIVNRDPAFDPPKFLTGAETAFRSIVTAFAAGDRGTLKPLLTENVFQTFDAAITARETAQERHRTEIKAITAATIEDAELLGDQAAVIVRFTSEQINQTLDAAGNVVQGSADIAQLTDLWTFERNLKAKDPIWRLAAARSG